MARVSNITLIDDHINTVECSGDSKSGAHPKIYLNVRQEDGKIECYYCGKSFIWKSFFKGKKVLKKGK
ncbi:MAG: zinc-finger domain-containing protein [Pseudomonadota bacterium]|nr:zinc-finger domain-containing protein [Pseudomonadota bacterium]MED5275020.1 zinc-finger domain-containing protein [Pseudomonadota bacterium]|tara:strand:- start:1429 stop:1632 length:204 start_codon:yes stop_codon:yes gene_type:complete